MTACSNSRRHGAVVAALVGAMSLGAPAVALATGGVDLLVVTGEDAFSGATVQAATIKYGGSAVTDSDNDGVYEVTYTRNAHVELRNVTLEMIGTTDKLNLKIDGSDDYKVTYYQRGTDGKNTGDAITGDITNVGKYVAVVEAVAGQYKGGVVYVPFDIEAVNISKVEVVDDTVTYNAEVHDDFEFVFNNGTIKAYEGDDYDVYYVPAGTDTTGANKTDVKDAGTYYAVIVGKGNYTGTVQSSNPITVNELDLANAPVSTTFSSSDTAPAGTYAICIDGEWYFQGDAIMGELVNTLVNPKDGIWDANGKYTYELSAKGGADNKNVVNKKQYDAYKVDYSLSFLYDGKALPESFDVLKNDADTKLDWGKLTAFTPDYTIDGLTVENGIGVAVYNSDGTDVTADDWQNTTGKYAVFVWALDGTNFVYGDAVAFNVNVYEEAVDADAQVAVRYDDKYVQSITKTFDNTDLTKAIKVVVEDEDGDEVDAADYSVKYYNADGKEVGQIVNAGTYTMKITSDTYKLSGTTEVPITVNKLDLATVESGAVDTARFEVSGVSRFEYLPWSSNGYAVRKVGDVKGLGLSFLDPEGNVVSVGRDTILDSVLKATIYDESGAAVDTITKEGVYTVKFEARNDDAANNYEIPADLVLTCIKDGSDWDEDNDDWAVDHVKFVDVRYTDYFADPVDYVTRNGFMNGYMVRDENGKSDPTGVFGAQDSLTRGQVACVLYNMARADGAVETTPTFDENGGYLTGFDDVDGHKYYAEAIAWAKMAGVVSGDTGTSNFRPDDEVSRQEFAAMLANYEKLYGDFEAPAADALDGFADASEVSAWATESVAWAAENGIIGNGGSLWATADIKRADAACMIYNYVG